MNNARNMRTLLALLFGFALSASAAVTTNVSYTYRTLMYDTNNTIIAPTNGLIYLHPLTNTALVVTNSSSHLVLYNTNGTKKEITAGTGALIIKSDSGQHLLELLDVGTLSIPFGDVYLGGTMYVTNVIINGHVNVGNALTPWAILSVGESSLYSYGFGVDTNGVIEGATAFKAGFRLTPDGLGFSHAKMVGARDVGANYSSYLAFFTESKASGTNDTSTEKMRIANSGNIGIGTTAPSAKLAINGGLNVGADTDPGDNNLSVVGNAYIATTGYANNLLATNTVYGNAASISNTITAGTINVATNVISANYMVGSTNGGTQTFTNYTTGSGGAGIVTNVWVFLNGLFITNTITE